MVPLWVLLLWTVAATLADDNVWLLAPFEHYTMATDNFSIVWSCDDDFRRRMTIELSNPAASGSNADPLITTVDSSESSTTLPVKFLPAIRPSETSVLDLTFYFTTTADPYAYGFRISDLSLIAPPPTTLTMFQTKTVTPTQPPQTITATAESLAPSPTTDEDSEEEDTGNGGLSTGAKAGIGVGVSAGVLLFAAGGLIVFRSRRQKGKAPKTVREISTLGPSLAVSGTGGDPDGTSPSRLSLPLPPSLMSSSGGPSEQRYELYEGARPASLPLPLSPLSASESPRSPERHELGG